MILVFSRDTRANVKQPLAILWKVKKAHLNRC